MTLTNYWWLLIWIFFAGFVLENFVKKEPVRVNGKIEYRWSWGAAMVLVLPYIVWAGFRGNNFGDTYTYRKTFWEVPDAFSQLMPYLSVNTKDQGFSVLMIVFKTIFGNFDVLFFLTVATFQMICLVAVYRKYSIDYWMCIFLFIVSTDYLSWMHNGMRQFIAATGIFACTNLMLKKKYVPLIILIFLLSQIHGSALLMIPMVFVAQGKAWNKRTLFFIVGIIAVITSVEQFTSLLDWAIEDTQYNDMLTNGIWENDDGTSIIRVLVYSVPAILSLIGKKYIDRAHDPMINFCTNMSIISAGFYVVSSVTSGIYIGRLPIYMSLYSYCLLPWLLRHMFTKKSSKLMYLGTIGAYLVFFYFQMHMAWGIL